MVILYNLVNVLSLLLQWFTVLGAIAGHKLRELRARGQKDLGDGIHAT